MLRRHTGALGLLSVMAVLLLASMREESFTTDEPLHLTRGLAWFWGGDTGFSYAHPPLGNAFAAAPIALFEPAIDMARLKGHSQHDVEQVARAWLHPHYERGRSYLLSARAAVAAMTLLLALHLYFFCLRIWGGRVAFWALFFFCLHPTLIAHGRLVTTDMPVTVTMCGAIFTLVLYLRSGSMVQLALCALLSGAAMATKYTALSLLPMIAALSGLTALLGKGRYRAYGRASALGRAACAVAVVGLVSLGLINASYRFENTGLTVRELLALEEPSNSITRPYRGKLLEKESVLAQLPAELPIPLPHTFLVGFTAVYVHARDGHASTFLGEFDDNGSVLYFPLLLFVKTPLFLWLALGAGAYLLLRTKRAPSLPVLLLSGFALLLLLAAMRTSINIGVRHVMPVMPVMAILGGLSVAHVLERRASPLPLAATPRVLLGAAMALHALGLTWAFPDYVSDFNALVLGRTYGQRISIVGEEWGQDMVRLGKEARARGIRSLRYNPDGFTAALELARYGVRATRYGCPRNRPPAGHVAVSARDLARDRRGCYAFTRSRPLLFDISGHVFVYAPEPEGQAPTARREP